MMKENKDDHFQFNLLISRYMIYFPSKHF